MKEALICQGNIFRGSLESRFIYKLYSAIKFTFMFSLISPVLNSFGVGTSQPVSVPQYFSNCFPGYMDHLKILGFTPDPTNETLQGQVLEFELQRRNFYISVITKVTSTQILPVLFFYCLPSQTPELFKDGMDAGDGCSSQQALCQMNDVIWSQKLNPILLPTSHKQPRDLLWVEFQRITTNQTSLNA